MGVMMKGVAAFVGVASASPTFQEWAAQYGFNGEDATMEEKYNANVAHMAELRQAHPLATFEVNQFSGMTFDEFAAQYLTLTGDPLAGANITTLETADPKTFAADVDWDVTPVKNQGSCGSCWAFSVMGAIEHGHKLATGQTVNLAEQQLVDCDTTSSGCSGGMTYTAMTWLAGKPIYTTSSYPYTARDGSCKTGSASGVTITGYQGLAKSEDGLFSGLQKQAVSGIIYADSSFQSYSSGILSSPTTCNLNHGIVVTGYGSNYIKIKNSWGTGWGEAGYIRVSRTTSGCGPFGLYYTTNSIPTGVTSSVEV